jgi:hypothetical protein
MQVLCSGAIRHAEIARSSRLAAAPEDVPLKRGHGFRESPAPQGDGTRGKRKGSAAKRYPGRARIECQP